MRKGMPTRTKKSSGSLSAAMALLIQTQAQFVSELAETRKEYAAIRQDLDTIKAILARHETLIQELRQAIRDTIGFNPESELKL
jgi:hypothetical protein